MSRVLIFLEYNYTKTNFWPSQELMLNNVCTFFRSYCKINLEITMKNNLIFNYYSWTAVIY